MKPNPLLLSISSGMRAGGHLQSVVIGDNLFVPLPSPEHREQFELLLEYYSGSKIEEWVFDDPQYTGFAYLEQIGEVEECEHGSAAAIVLITSRLIREGDTESAAALWNWIDHQAEPEPLWAIMREMLPWSLSEAQSC